MMRIRDVREALSELKERRKNGELASYAYDRQKQKILQKGFLNEESGPRHRYPTRRRLGIISEEPIEKKEKKACIAFNLDDFIDNRNSNEISVEIDTDDIINSSKEEVREDHHFPLDIVIDCTELKKTGGKPITFPENFFKRVIQ